MTANTYLVSPIKTDMGVCRRDIQMTVFMPAKYAWDFMKFFGECFTTNNEDRSSTPRQVDGYIEKDGSMHITVTLEANVIESFNLLLETFAKDNNLSLDN